MTIKELNEKLYELTSMYFEGATVAFAQTKSVKSASTLVTLKTGSVSRPLHAVNQIADGDTIGAYQSRTILEVNLFTKGESVEVAGSTKKYTVNTAVNDLSAFVDFIASPFGDFWCFQNDVSIFPNGPVNDITKLINDTTWEYRAMVELNVDFVQTSVGATAVLSDDSIHQEISPTNDQVIYPPSAAIENPITIVPEWEQTASGGGSQTLADKTTGYFEQVEIEEEHNNEQS